MRTASRRARRLGGLLLVAATVWWAFLRRRANAVRWVEPPVSLPARGAPTEAAPAAAVPDTAPHAADTGSDAARDTALDTAPEEVPAEPGTPGELPDDVLATDAGLTELPDRAGEVGAGEGPADTVDTVDEASVAEILAVSPDAEVVVVDETTYEHAVADAAPEPPGDPAAAPAAVIATGPAESEPSPTAAGLDAVGEETTEVGLGTGAPSGAAADDEPTERELAAPEVEESIGVGLDDERSRGIAMPSFSEAPTAEIPAVTDDLRAVRGIGPSMERTLQSLGIVSYRQLAMLDGAELERVRAELTDFRGRIEREDWVGQARALYRQKYGRDPA